MTQLELYILILIMSLLLALYTIYRYCSNLVEEIYARIEHSEENNCIKIDRVREMITAYVNKQEHGFSDYAQNNLEFTKLKDEVQNNALCCANGINSMLRDISEVRVDEIARLDEALGKVITDLEDLTKKSESISSTICCKAGIEKSNLETHRIEARLKRIEETIYTSESRNKNGERVISVVVPELADLPIADNLSFDIRKNNRIWPITQELCPKSKEEEELIAKYEDFEETVTSQNILLLEKIRPKTSVRLNKIKNLYQQGEATYIAIKRLQKDLKESK